MRNFFTSTWYQMSAMYERLVQGLHGQASTSPGQDRHLEDVAGQGQGRTRDLESGQVLGRYLAEQVDHRTDQERNSDPASQVVDSFDIYFSDNRFSNN